MKKRVVNIGGEVRHVRSISNFIGEQKAKICQRCNLLPILFNTYIEEAMEYYLEREKKKTGKNRNGDKW